MRSIRQLSGAVCRRLFYPLLPAKMHLPFAFWLSSWDGSCEPELKYLSRYCNPGNSAVDIGANFGLYSYALSKIFKKVYSFEINEEVTSALVQHNGTNIEVIHAGLSSHRAECTFYLPTARGRELSGWGSLDPKNCPDASSLREKQVLLKPLDDFGLKEINFIKMDVEGHEVEALRGSSKTIDSSRPTVLIEVKEKNRAEVDQFFAEKAYSAKTLDQIVGVAGSAETLIYLPRAADDSSLTREGRTGAAS